MVDEKLLDLLIRSSGRPEKLFLGKSENELGRIPFSLLEGQPEYVVNFVRQVNEYDCIMRGTISSKENPSLRPELKNFKVSGITADRWKESFQSKLGKLREEFIDQVDKTNEGELTILRFFSLAFPEPSSFCAGDPILNPTAFAQSQQRVSRKEYLWSNDNRAFAEISGQYPSPGKVYFMDPNTLVSRVIQDILSEEAISKSLDDNSYVWNSFNIGRV